MTWRRFVVLLSHSAAMDAVQQMPLDGGEAEAAVDAWAVG